MVGGVGSMNIDSQSRNMQVRRPSEHGWVIGRSLGSYVKRGLKGTRYMDLKQVVRVLVIIFYTTP